MRLVCPNCAAQYEVDASMIPDEGRDVQCSSCGHTWFEQPETTDALLDEEAGLALEDPVEPEDDAPEDDTNADPAPPKPRPVDAAAREILREEAAREAEVRRREAENNLETQPDLGLGDPDGAEARAAAAKARIARLRDTPEEATEEDAEAAAAAVVEANAADSSTRTNSRREMLPDIEEINSTLTATGDRPEGEGTEEDLDQAKTRRGFRFGFLTVVLILLLLVLLYLFAPQLAEAVPALAPALSGYLNLANSVLDGIDGLMRSAVESMNGPGDSATQ